jgi:hypothetical protein
MAKELRRQRQKWMKQFVLTILFSAKGDCVKSGMNIQFIDLGSERYNDGALPSEHGFHLGAFVFPFSLSRSQ